MAKVYRQANVWKVQHNEEFSIMNNRNGECVFQCSGVKEERGEITTRVVPPRSGGV